MDKTLIQCASYFEKLKKDFFRVDNKNIKQDYQRIGQDINNLKRLYALKIRLILDTNEEIKHLVYQMADVELFMRETLSDVDGLHGAFQSTEHLGETEWSNLSHMGQMRLLDNIIGILDDFVFFYGIYRTELQDVGITLIKMKRDVGAIKNNMWLEMDLDRKLNNEVAALYQNMAGFESRLNNLVAARKIEKDLEMVSDILDANNNIQDVNPQPGPGVVDVEAELREAAMDLAADVQKDEGYDSGVEDDNIKKDEIDNN